MKKTFLCCFAFIAFGFFQLQAQTPTVAQTTLKYISASNKYQVCIKFNQNGPVSVGSSLISLCIPGATANNKIAITSVNGGGWDDNSVTYDEGGKDYHGITTTGQSGMAYGTAGTELVLFEFSMSVGCITGLRLWDQSLGDKTQTNDGTDYISNIFTPANNNYILTTNYGSVPSCPGAIGGDLELTASIGISPVAKGGITTYTLTVLNKDNKNHSNVQVKAPLPTGFSYVSHAPSTNTYNSSTGIWDIGSISSTQNSVTITITIQANAEGSYVFDAEIFNMNGTDSDSTPNNNTMGEDDQTQTCASVPVVYCPNETINYEANAPANRAPYQWYESIDGVTYTAIVGATTQSITITNTGYYKFTLDGSALDPQCGAQLCCPIVVQRVPGAAANAGTANPAYKLCFTPGQAQATIDLANLLTGEDTGGTWAVASGTPGTNFVAATGSFDPNALAQGTYTFTYTVGTLPCQDTETVTVILLGSCCPPKQCIGTVLVRKL
jgi:uncharacterized repeat protein (TIGR01451 family)